MLNITYIFYLCFILCQQFITKWLSTILKTSSIISVPFIFLNYSNLRSFTWRRNSKQDLCFVLTILLLLLICLILMMLFCIELYSYHICRLNGSTIIYLELDCNKLLIVFLNVNLVLRFFYSKFICTFSFSFCFLPSKHSCNDLINRKYLFKHIRRYIKIYIYRTIANLGRFCTKYAHLSQTLGSCNSLQKKDIIRNGGEETVPTIYLSSGV